VKCYNCEPDGIVHGHLLPQLELAEKMAELNKHLAAEPNCRECGVSHIRMSHADYRKRLVAAFQTHMPKAKYAPAS